MRRRPQVGAWFVPLASSLSSHQRFLARCCSSQHDVLNGPFRHSWQATPVPASCNSGGGWQPGAVASTHLPADADASRWDGVEQRQQLGHVVAIGADQGDRDRYVVRATARSYPGVPRRNGQACSSPLGVAGAFAGYAASFGW